MSNIRPPGKAFKRPITAWFTRDDYDFLKRIAAENKVTVSAYMRAVLIDAIAEERERSSNAKTNGQGAIVIAGNFGLR